MMKKRMIKTGLVMALCGGMFFGSVTVPTGMGSSVWLGTQEVYAYGRELAQILRNISTLQESVNRLQPAEKGIFATVGDICSPLTTPMGVYISAATLLKLTGVMKDPAEKALANIQSTLSGMNATLKNLRSTLIGIAGKLDDIEVGVKELNRSTQLSEMNSLINNFTTNYANTLNAFLYQYEDYINAGFRSWFGTAEKDAISIYFTDDVSGKNLQVFSWADSVPADPAVSVEGYTVNSGSTITIDSEYVTHAMKGAGFNVNTYRATIITKLAEEVRLRADEGTLTAGSEFYNMWAKLTEEEKQEKADTIAEQAYNALASGISHEKMEANTEFVSSVLSTFNACCESLTGDNSVLDATLKSMYLTHGFEYEIRDEIYNTIDRMTVFTGTFATLALTVGQQNSGQSQMRLDTVQDNWTAVTEHFKNVREDSVTGYDNYCYLTNTLVTYETRDLTYKNTIENRYDTCGVLHSCLYKENGCRYSDLLEDGDRIMNTADTTILYKLSGANGETGKFYQYLEKASTGASAGSGKTLVTEYHGWCDFDPSDGIAMNYGYRANHGGDDYWGESFQATVNSGNDSGVENQYFSNCKKATAAVFNPDNGKVNTDQILGAMAVYAESHGYWIKDEMYLLGMADSGNFNKYTCQVSTYEITNNVCNFKTTCAVLVLKDLPDKPALAEETGADAMLMAPAVHNEYSASLENAETKKEMSEEIETDLNVDVSPETEDAAESADTEESTGTAEGADTAENAGPESEEGTAADAAGDGEASAASTQPVPEAETASDI